MRHRFLAFHRPRRAGRHRFLEGLRMFLFYAVAVPGRREHSPRLTRRFKTNIATSVQNISTSVARDLFLRQGFRCQPRRRAMMYDGRTLKFGKLFDTSQIARFYLVVISPLRGT